METVVITGANRDIGLGLTRRFLDAGRRVVATCSLAGGFRVGIAFVTDESLLGDARLDFAKCSYVAIGIAHDTGDREPVDRLRGILAGTIGRFFGTGNR